MRELAAERRTRRPSKGRHADDHPRRPHPRRPLAGRHNSSRVDPPAVDTQWSPSPRPLGDRHAKSPSEMTCQGSTDSIRALGMVVSPDQPRANSRDHQRRRPPTGRHHVVTNQDGRSAVDTRMPRSRPPLEGRHARSPTETTAGRSMQKASPTATTAGRSTPGRHQPRRPVSGRHAVASIETTARGSTQQGARSEMTAQGSTSARSLPTAAGARGTPSRFGGAAHVAMPVGRAIALDTTVLGAVVLQAVVLGAVVPAREAVVLDPVATAISTAVSAAVATRDSDHRRGSAVVAEIGSGGCRLPRRRVTSRVRSRVSWEVVSGRWPRRRCRRRGPGTRRTGRRGPRCGRPACAVRSGRRSCGRRRPGAGPRRCP